MSNRRLGANGPAVSPMSLGCMGMSGAYGPADREESIATIHAALEAGVELLDNAVVSVDRTITIRGGGGLRGQVLH